MYLKNAWYVAALASEVKDGKIVSRKILEQDIAIFRTEAGKYVALRDACIHRQAPLSLGKIVGEDIECRYHGARYGADGRCTLVPGQRAISPKALVRSFPVLERHDFLWLWMGDPTAQDDGSSIPDSFALMAPPRVRQRRGSFLSMQANYRLLNDNLFDITHAEFVHPETFGGEEVRFYRNARAGTEPIDRGLTFEIKDRSIHFRTHADSLGDEGAPLWRIMMAQAHGVPEWTEPLDFTMAVNWFAPCYTSFHLYMRPVGRPDVPAVEFHDFHAAIPETANTAHYFYMVGINYGDPDAVDAFAASAKNVFMQDVTLLEAQQRVVGSRDVLDVEHVSFNGDRLQLEGRRILEGMINAEQVQA